MVDNQFEIIDEKKNRGFMLLVALACFFFEYFSASIFCLCRDYSKIEYANVDYITIVHFS